MPSSACALPIRSEEHTSELQSHLNLVCRLLLEKQNRRATEMTNIVNLWKRWGMSGDRCARRLYMRHHGDDVVTVRVTSQLVHVVFFLKNRAPPGISPLPPHALLRR